MNKHNGWVSRCAPVCRLVLVAGLLEGCDSDNADGQAAKADAGSDAAVEETPDASHGNDHEEDASANQGPGSSVDETNEPSEDSGAPTQSSASNTDTASGSSTTPSNGSSSVATDGTSVGDTASLTDDSPSSAATSSESAVTSTDASEQTSEGPSCEQGALCTPGNLGVCGLYAIDCTQGEPVCQRIGNQLAGTECDSGKVCTANGSCEACEQGASCSPEASPCKVGTLSCSSGASCQATAANQPDGTVCGAGKVCDSGACVACVEDELCEPAEGPCVEGRTRCGTGTAVCEAVRSITAGEACGGGNVCDGEGECVACVNDSECVPDNTCHYGSVVCSGTGSTCQDTGDELPDDVFCDVGKLCDLGSCVDAGNWISRGEDNHAFTGGWVFTFASDGASIEPATSAALAFAPTAGGLSGKALQVSGLLPETDSETNTYPTAALGITFTDAATAVNLDSRGRGIEFYIKSSTELEVNVQIADIWTDIKYSNCSTASSSSVTHACYDYPAATCTVEEDWTLCRVLWTNLTRPDWGNLGAGMPLDAENATFILVNPLATPYGDPTHEFSYAIDDVRFVE